MQTLTELYYLYLYQLFTTPSIYGNLKIILPLPTFITRRIYYILPCLQLPGLFYPPLQLYRGK